MKIENIGLDELKIGIENFRTNDMNVILIELVAGIIFLLYGLCILGLSYGWQKLKKSPSLPSGSTPETHVSIVIAVRDEEENIDMLLRHLAKQEYPLHLFEIILADDHSQDNTLKIIDQLKLESDLNIRVIHNAPQEVGKKAALNKGMLKAKGELLITTDADCTMGKYWLRSMVAFYEKEQPYLIMGPVLYKTYTKKAFERFQVLEFFSLLAASAGAAGLNRPLFCNAANMAFNREIINTLNDPLSSETPSGDDTMLLLSIKKEYPGKIRFNNDRYALVETFPEKTWRDFWNQRKRWVSKSKYYHDFDIIFASFMVFVTNLLLIVFLILMCFSSLFIDYFIAFFILKLLIDSLFLFPVIHYFKKYDVLPVYLPLQILYPFYAITTALGGKFSGFKWKNRYYHVN